MACLISCAPSPVPQEETQTTAPAAVEEQQNEEQTEEGMKDEESPAIAAEKAVEIAGQQAEGLGFSTEGHAVTSELEGDRWVVTYSPTDPNRLGGGLVVEVSKGGKVLTYKYQQ